MCDLRGGRALQQGDQQLVLPNEQHECMRQHLKIQLHHISRLKQASHTKAKLQYRQLSTHP